MYARKVIVALALLSPTAHALGAPDAEENRRRLLDCSVNTDWRRVDGKGKLQTDQDCEWVNQAINTNCPKNGQIGTDTTEVKAKVACSAYCEEDCDGKVGGPTGTTTTTTAAVTTTTTTSTPGGTPTTTTSTTSTTTGTTGTTTTTTFHCNNNEYWYRVSDKKQRVEYTQSCEWVRQDTWGRCLKWGTSDTSEYDSYGDTSKVEWLKGYDACPLYCDSRCYDAPKSPTVSPTHMPHKTPTKPAKVTAPAPTYEFEPTPEPTFSRMTGCDNSRHWLRWAPKKGRSIESEDCDWVNADPETRCRHIDGRGVSAYDACPNFCQAKCYHQNVNTKFAESGDCKDCPGCDVILPDPAWPSTLHGQTIDGTASAKCVCIAANIDHGHIIGSHHSDCIHVTGDGNNIAGDAGDDIISVVGTQNDVYGDLDSDRASGCTNTGMDQCFFAAGAGQADAYNIQCSCDKVDGKVPASPDACFDKDGKGKVHAVKNCECHPTCATCGYDNPRTHPDEVLGSDDCITCAPGLELTAVHPDGTGTCTACFNTDKDEKLFGVPGDCKCHDSCETCGFTDKPEDANDCIKCKAGFVLVEDAGDGTGFCTACFDKDVGDTATGVVSPVKDCTCHESCATCGYGSDPTNDNDCITCKPGFVLVKDNEDGTGYCTACFDKDDTTDVVSPVEDCTCHDSCATCGYNDEPTDDNDCITCKPGFFLNKMFDDGTGTCDEMSKVTTTTTTTTATTTTTDGGVARA